MPFGTYARFYKEQAGCCVLRGRYWDRLRLDHCHETNVVRGLLCNGRIGALGQFGDDAAGISRALEYVQGRK